MSMKSEVLASRNGFYALESALHVFPLGPVTETMDFERWNSFELWRFEYEDMLDGLTFFAEDIFGGQFAFSDNGIGHMEPETGEFEPLTRSLEDWAALVLDDVDRTGFTWAHEWQLKNGPLPDGKRLVAKTPFVGGGQHSLDNMGMVDSVEAMRWRGCFARQIRHLPDGAATDLKVV